MIFFGMTDSGQIRPTNQDVFYTHRFDENKGFAIVCDGMGGTSGGNIASDIVCRTISEYLITNNIQNADENIVKNLIMNGINKANEEVFEKSRTTIEYKGMGTTVVVAVICNGKAIVAHIGDSRAYLLKNKKLYQITKDHSYVQELFEQGKITKEELKNHPKKHMITRAVGVSDTVTADFYVTDFDDSTKLLICTDGLTNMVEDSVIEKILKKYSPNESCKRLIDAANDEGGADNITVAVIG